MRLMKVVTVICWLIAAAALLGLACWFLSGTIFGVGTKGWFSGVSFGNGGGNLRGAYEVAGTYNVSPSGIDSIDINWVSGDVTVKPYDGSEIQFIEYSRRELGSDEYLSYSESGGTLTIKYSIANSLIYMPTKKLEVFVPRTLCDNLVRFNIDSTSADVNVDNISASTYRIKSTSGSVNASILSSRTLDIGTTSGTITLKSATADDMKVHSTSGTMRVSEVYAATLDARGTSGTIRISDTTVDTITVHSVSGGMHLEDVVTGYLEGDTTSGSIELEGSIDSASLKSNSGKITLSSSVAPASLIAKTTSGSIIVTIPGDSTVSVSHSTTSGKFSSEVPTIMNTSDPQFRLSSTSGNIKILAG